MAFGRTKRGPTTTTTNVTTSTTTTTQHPDGTITTKEGKPSLMDKLRAKNSTSRTNPAPGTTTKPKRSSRLGGLTSRGAAAEPPVTTRRKPTMGEKMKAKMKGTDRTTATTY